MEVGAANSLIGPAEGGLDAGKVGLETGAEECNQNPSSRFRWSGH